MTRSRSSELNDSLTALAAAMNTAAEAPSVEIDTPPAVEPVIDAEQARQVILSIHQDLSSAREKLFFLYAHRAWEPLGYGSWHEMLTTEFSGHHSYLRRVTAAAQLEANVGVAIGTHRESHLRAISEVLDDEELQREAYALAIEYDASTAQDFRKAAWDTYVTHYGNDRIHRRLDEGVISSGQAYGLTVVLGEATTRILRDVVSRCSDPELAGMILELSKKGGETYEEICVSGTVPAYPEPVPLHKATASNLRAWLDVASAEHRAAAVEGNRERYQEREKHLDALFTLMGKLLDLLENVTEPESIPQVKELSLEVQKHINDYRALGV